MIWNGDNFLKKIDKQISKGMKNVATDMLDLAKTYVPVKTGKLKSSITKSSDATSASISTNCDYWADVEYGTHKMKAQPFLRPSMDHIAHRIFYYIKEQ